MRLWGTLYVMIWAVFFEVLLGMIPIWPPVLLDLHAVLGVLIVWLAYRNFAALRASRVPGRLKRTASATFYLSVLMLVLGALLFANLGTGWTIPVLQVTVYHAILFVHIVNALAILAQVAAVAVAYDMWEEREFEHETAPGEIPPPPAMAPPGGLARV